MVFPNIQAAYTPNLPPASLFQEAVRNFSISSKTFFNFVRIFFSALEP